MSPAKRWLSVARPAGGGWWLDAPEPVGETASLFARLLARAGGGTVALGVDFPLGLPRAWAAGRREADFPRFLAGIGDRPGFFEVCATLDQVSPERPFYPARGVRGMTRAAHAAALGLADARALSRACDRATATRPAGAPLFWTLGANQTGKAAIAAWRDLPLAAPFVRLWPFAGGFRGLLAPGLVVLAETYPAEALRQLGLRLSGSKRRQADRAALAPALRAALAEAGAVAAPALAVAIGDGFGADAAGEDRFDCVIGVLGVLGVLAGRRPDTVPADDPWLRRWEGWVLGQTDRPVDWPDADAPQRVPYSAAGSTSGAMVSTSPCSEGARKKQLRRPV